MAVSDHVARFVSLGFGSKDVRHISVSVYPALELAPDGEPMSGHKMYIGSDNGDLSTDYPTDYIFVLSDENWVFESFDLAGKTWPGLAILPDDGDYTVTFGDPGQRSVILSDKCGKFYTHRYQMMIRNTQTNELVITDPSSKNADRDDD